MEKKRPVEAIKVDEQYFRRVVRDMNFLGFVFLIIGFFTLSTLIMPFIIGSIKNIKIVFSAKVIICYTLTFLFSVVSLIIAYGYFSKNKPWLKQLVFILSQKSYLQCSILEI